MSHAVDYYKILGVLPDAEQIVIVAAYRALASLYHPDRWKGDKDESNRRMAEINVAYGVIGDVSKRAEYDRSRSTGTTSMDDAEESMDAAFDSAISELEARWQIAVSVVTDLSDIRKRLNKTAHRLAFAFMVLMLERKDFQNRHEIASRLERRFLEERFGTDPKVVNFAKELIELGQRQAVRRLNQYVDVLGSKLDAFLIIEKIVQEFSIDDYRNKYTKRREAEEERQEAEEKHRDAEKKRREAEELKKKVRNDADLDAALAVVSNSDLVVQMDLKTVFSDPKWSVYTKAGEKILDGATAFQLTKWVSVHLC